MAKTKCVISLELPTSSIARLGDFIVAVRSVIGTHKGTDFHVTYSGPFPGDTEAQSDDRSSDLGRSRPDPEPEAEPRARRAEPAEGSGAGDPDAEPVKRKRGRPAGSRNRDAEEAGSAAGSEQRAPRSVEPAEGRRGHEPRGTDEGPGEGRDEGEGRTRGAGRDRGDQRGDAEAARVAPKSAPTWDDEEPAKDLPAAPKAKGNVLTREELELHYAQEPDDEEWPDKLMPAGELDKAMLGEILSQHFEQTNDRDKTLQVLKDATGERSLPNVHPDDYDKAARALLKDAAKIRHGIKKA